MPGFITRRPNNHHHSLGQKSDRLEARLAIIRRVFWTVIVGPAKTIDASETPLAESSLTLRRIERDLHTIKCTPI
jgi:hypothetical protein